MYRSIALCFLLSVAAPAQAPDVRLLEGLSWRFVGPATMGGRATDVEGVPGNPALVYAGFGTAGLWKTVNAGHSWTPLFEKQPVYSIGDFALQPGNPDVIWAGTGESNTRNSASFGNGVYKSTDGGKTWKHLGLEGTERISRVLVHPTNPDVAWVGALGRAYGRSPERGVFRTTDGGRTWRKTLFIDDQHGVADMDVNPANPNVLYAAMWKFERKPWTHTSGSDNGGVFRSIDGGITWQRLTKGLPKLMGRIGVKVAPSNPRVVYVIAECKEGTLFRSDDGGDSFRKISDNREIVSRGFYYADLRVDPADENRVYAVASTLFVSIDGGKSWKSIVNGTHIDYHALWIDPANPRRLWNGNDGGLAVSYDGGETWEAVYNIPLGQFYQISADNRQPFYYIMGGLQDNGSWTGPSRTREPAGIFNSDWKMVQFGDGFHVLNHPDDPELYLSESQGGYVARTDFRTREQQYVTVQPLSPAGGPASDGKYRFNWNSPLVASPHDKNTVFLGGNVLFRSTDFGKTWSAISPDLTTNDKEKQKPAGGPVWYDNSSAEYHCTIISVAESPHKAGHIWVGTDDGNLQVSRDGGKSWNNIIGNVKGVPAHSPVSHIELSRVSENTAYVAFDRHMLDDFRPYIFQTSDGGATWTAIAGNLPEKAHVHVVREDPKNPKLLYAGTELGLYVSYNGGARWDFLGLKNLPAVPVHDIVVHPRDNDLILGTHGRSIVILDDAAAVQQFDARIAASDIHLFPPKPALRFASRPTGYGFGGAVYKGPNPPYGAILTYYLKEEAPEKNPPRLQVLDSSGKLIRTIRQLPREKGVQRAVWDLRADPPTERKAPTPEELEFGGGLKGVHVLPGTYTVRLVAGAEGKEQTAAQPLEVRLDPTLRVDDAALRKRHELAVRLSTMVDEGNKVLRVLDGIGKQLDQTENLLKQQSEDKAKAMRETLEGYRKALAEAVALLGLPLEAPRLEQGPRLMEKLEDLYRLVEGANASPTPAMELAFAELEPQFTVNIRMARAFLSSKVSEWNKALGKEGLPTLMAVSP